MRMVMDWLMRDGFGYAWARFGSEGSPALLGIQAAVVVD